jgi:beta-galactosidase/beta-glucuronidase
LIAIAFNFHFMSEIACPNPLNEDWILVPKEFSSPPSVQQTMQTTSQSRTLTLSHNWEWKQKAKDEPDVEALAVHDGWRKTSIPSEIFKDLLEAGDIPDPHLDQNENDVQWVGEVNWLYRTRFTLDTMPNNLEKAVLVFDGLDTYADVYFNSILILRSEVNVP